MVPVGMFWRHAHPLTARLLKQNVEFGESNREVVEKAQLWLDRELSDGRPYLTGDTYTIADLASKKRSIRQRLGLSFEDIEKVMVAEAASGAA